MGFKGVNQKLSAKKSYSYQSINIKKKSTHFLQESISYLQIFLYLSRLLCAFSTLLAAAAWCLFWAKRKVGLGPDL